MEERVREPEERHHKAQPVGCPWQVLSFRTNTVDCRLKIAQQAPDQQCQTNCDAYTTISSLNEKIKKLGDELHDAKCEKQANSEV